MLAQQASQAVTQIFDTPEVWNGALAQVERESEKTTLTQVVVDAGRSHHHRQGAEGQTLAQTRSKGSIRNQVDQVIHADS